MNDFENIFNEIKNYFENFEKQNYKISSKSVGWHIDHSLRTINNAVFELKNSNPTRFAYAINHRRTFLFFCKKIKRKSLRSPRSNRNFGNITLEELIFQFELAKSNITTIEKSNTKSNFNHPYFGQLNIAQTCIFLNIHTKHHVEIIKDIIK